MANEFKVKHGLVIEEGSITLQDASITTIVEIDGSKKLTYATKLSAYNKNFAGTGTATTISHSDHNHSGVYEPVHSHPYLPLTGGTITGNVYFGDADIIYFGESADALITWSDRLYIQTASATTGISITAGSSSSLSLIGGGVSYKLENGSFFSTGTADIGRTANRVANIYAVNIDVAKISNLTGNGFVKTSGSDGTLSVDTATYLTGNQTITLSGIVTGSGATAITTAFNPASNLRIDDGYKFFVGTGADSYWTHNGTDSWFVNGTGKFLIYSSASATGIEFHTFETARWEMNNSGYFLPMSDGNLDIGTTTVRPRYIYTDNLDTPKIGNLTANGFVKTSGSDGTLSVDTTSYGALNSTNTWTATQTFTDYLNILAPPAPTTLILTEVEDYINVQFNRSSSTTEDSYEIWRSSTSSTIDFNLIGLIENNNISATMSINDNDYSRNTTVYYRVYTIKTGKRSTALTGSKTPGIGVDDVTNLTVTPLNDVFVVNYNIAYDRRLAYIEIKMDSNLVLESLTESNATSVYQGMSEEYTYKILSGDEDKYHQFWVYSIIRT